MSKLKQRFGLKKQGSKSLASADSTPSNLYPMAAGGHHRGNPHVQGQTPTPDPTAAHPGQRSSPQDPAYSGSADMQEGHAALAAQDSGRLLVQGSAGNEEAEEQAMMELALKVGLCIRCVQSLCVKQVQIADCYALYTLACRVRVCMQCISALASHPTCCAMQAVLFLFCTPEGTGAHRLHAQLAPCFCWQQSDHFLASVCKGGIESISNCKSYGGGGAVGVRGPG